MSTFSKVFTVLLVVFSVAFTSMAVSVVSRTTNWKETAERYEQHARVADTNLRNLIAASAAELATARDSVKAHMERVSELERQVQTQTTQLASLRAEVAKTASEKSSVSAMNRGLLAQLQAAESARGQYQTQRDALERRGVDLERRSVDLNDRVNELTASVTVLREEKRQFEQQLHILQQENDRLSNASRQPGSGELFESPSGLALEGIQARTPVSGSPVRGKITEIDGQLVTISVGSADGVKKGMVFVIHRAEEYIGDLTVSAVDPNQSAGRLKLTAGTPILGDVVTDARRMGSPRG